MNNKRLLMISTDTSLFEEGSAVRVRQVQYAKDFEEVHIIVATTKGEEAHIAPNIWLYPSRSKHKILFPLDAIRLGRFVIEKRNITDVTCQDPFFTAMAGTSLKKEFSTKGIVLHLEIQIHTDVGSLYFGRERFSNRIRQWMARSHIPQADHVRVVSKKIADYVIGRLGVDANKVEIRPIFVDVEKIKNAPIIEGADLHKKYPQFEKIILMASRLEKEKNIEMAIEAFAEVLKKYPKAGLVIVGKGTLSAKLKMQSIKWRIADSVMIEDWVSLETLYSYYKTTDVFLNTSWYEGYGMTLVEAHAAGCAIVSTDVGVAPELGPTLVRPEVSDIAHGIIEALRV